MQLISISSLAFHPSFVIIIIIWVLSAWSFMCVHDLVHDGETNVLMLFSKCTKFLL